MRISDWSSDVCSSDLRSVYLAQPLANKGIAVLQVGPPPPGSSTHPFDEAKVRMHGYEAAIDDLCSAGLVDRHRVGIMGHSRAGWHVEYALAFSSFPFAAAIVDDNIDSGYFEAGFAGWTDEQMRNGAKRSEEHTSELQSLMRT